MFVSSDRLRPAVIRQILWISFLKTLWSNRPIVRAEELDLASFARVVLISSKTHAMQRMEREGQEAAARSVAYIFFTVYPSSLSPSLSLYLFVCLYLCGCVRLFGSSASADLKARSSHCDYRILTLPQHISSSPSERRLSPALNVSHPSPSVSNAYFRLRWSTSA